MKNFLRTSVFKFTDDDWYGNYSIEAVPYYDNRSKLVEVSLLTLTPDPNSDTTRVCIWGNDDCGLERDYDNRQEATDMFMLVIGQQVVNKKWLKDHGFIHA